MEKLMWISYLSLRFDVRYGIINHSNRWNKKSTLPLERHKKSRIMKMNTKVLFVKKALKSITCATLSLLPALSRAVTELRSLSAARLKAGKSFWLYHIFP